MEKLRWGIISTGRIARIFANGIIHSAQGHLHAFASRNIESAQECAAAFPRQDGSIPAAYGSYEELLADPEVDAVYIATPHPSHAEWAIAAARAGKHILCEKPIAINARDTSAILAAAREHGVFLMEAFMYRCHPQAAKLRELLEQRLIGDVRFIRATFSYQTPFDPESRCYKHELGGGGILDVGCYPVSIARFIAGAVNGTPFEEPVEFKAVGVIGTSGVDEFSVATARFPGNIVAELASGVSVMLENNVRIVGSEGSLLIPAPWQPAKDGGFSKIIHFKEGVPSEIIIETPYSLYSIEADHVAAQIALGRTESPAMSWSDTLGNMQTLDRWREEIGLRYNWE